ncbi:MAG TPA: hypothetical protein ENK49_06215 [Gammaproteobacteria bacterium]|nr:hypothetical protein [Gammaproteobacteria bacterium]
MKQIILLFTLIVAVTAAILAYRFMADDARTGVAGTEPVNKPESGVLPSEARMNTVPESENRERTVPLPGAGRGLPDENDAATLAEPGGITPPAGMSADPRAGYMAEGAAETAEGNGNAVPGGTVTTDGSVAEGENAGAGGGTASGLSEAPGTGGVSRSSGSGRDRAQNAVNSPSMDVPFLDKTYPDGRQYRPNAMQDYFADESVEPENPVSEEKAGYYPEGRDKMKDVFRDLKK